MKFYAMMDTEDLVYVGDFDGYDAAFDAADKLGNYNWVFSEEGLKSFVASINRVLWGVKPEPAIEEFSASIGFGYELRAPDTIGVDDFYIRIVNRYEEEMVYWDWTEFMDPGTVIALFGAIQTAIEGSEWPGRINENPDRD